MIKAFEKPLLVVCALVFIGFCLAYCVIGLHNNPPKHKTTFEENSSKQRAQSNRSSHGSVKSRLHLVVTFPLLEDGKTTRNSGAHKRMMEYSDCLAQFLLNDNVYLVHLLHDSLDMPRFINKTIGSHTKLKLHNVTSPGVVLTLHDFAFTHLQGEVVVITHADILLGEGVEKINRTLLVQHNLMYSLSRHETPKSKQRDMCDRYWGSHDTYIFVPRGEISVKGRELLNHPVTSWGTENMIMYVYWKLLHYKILNPCKLIKVYHVHHSNYRPNIVGRIKVTKNPSQTVIKIPTDKLL